MYWMLMYLHNMLLIRLLLKIWNNLAIFFNIVFILLKERIGGRWRPQYYEDISYTTATADDYHGYRKNIHIQLHLSRNRLLIHFFVVSWWLLLLLLRWYSLVVIYCIELIHYTLRVSIIIAALIAVVRSTTSIQVANITTEISPIHTPHLRESIFV